MPAHTHLSQIDARLLQQLLSSSTGALSLPELRARNTTRTDELQEQLTDLLHTDPPLITTLRADPPVPTGIPGTYYAVTEDGITLLKQAGLYEQIGILHDLYSAADLTCPDASSVSIDEIESYDGRPTPEWL